MVFHQEINLQCPRFLKIYLGFLLKMYNINGEDYQSEGVGLINLT